MSFLSFLLYCPLGSHQSFHHWSNHLVSTQTSLSSHGVGGGRTTRHRLHQTATDRPVGRRGRACGRPGRRQQRTADHRLCQSAGAATYAGHTASPPSGAPRATNSGSRARHRATRSISSKCASTASRTRCSIWSAHGARRLPHQGRRRHRTHHLLLSPPGRRRT